MNLRTLAVLAATALAGVAAWPAFVTTREAQASAPTPAPVLADYVHRDRLVAFYEGAVRDRPDQIVTRLLASQYLQRFRERGDAGDALRGERMAERSLELQPRFNAGAEMTLASSLTSLHRFREALVHANDALRDRARQSGRARAGREHGRRAGPVRRCGTRAARRRSARRRRRRLDGPGALRRGHRIARAGAAADRPRDNPDRQRDRQPRRVARVVPLPRRRAGVVGRRRADRRAPLP